VDCIFSMMCATMRFAVRGLHRANFAMTVFALPATSSCTTPFANRQQGKAAATSALRLRASCLIVDLGTVDPIAVATPSLRATSPFRVGAMRVRVGNLARDWSENADARVILTFSRERERQFAILGRQNVPAMSSSCRVVLPLSRMTPKFVPADAGERRAPLVVRPGAWRSSAQRIACLMPNSALIRATGPRSSPSPRPCGSSRSPC